MPKFCSLLLLSFAALFLVFAVNAEAFVVQRKESALSFNNISRAAASSTVAKEQLHSQADEKEKNQRNEENTSFQYDHEPINYLEIADKLIPEDRPKKLYVDMRKKIIQNISAKPGQTFFIVLPEKNNSFWKTDETLTLAEIVSSEHSGNLRILEFRVLCCGENKFFIDNFINGQNQALESKIIRLQVHK